MNILVMALSTSDLNSCFGTILKFIKRKYSVYLLMIFKKSKPSQKIPHTFSKLLKKVGVSETFFINEFDFSVVTQQNVHLLRSFVEQINPKLALFPSTASKDECKVIVGKSSILACRGVSNLLMYDSDLSPNFCPMVYSSIRNVGKIQENLMGVKNQICGKNKMKKVVEKRKIYGKCQDLYDVEAFESTRIILLNEGGIF